MINYFTFTEKLTQTLNQLRQKNDSQAYAQAAYAFPELLFFFEIDEKDTAVYGIEHNIYDENPLWSHLKVVLESKLRGLELAQESLFQKEAYLSHTNFNALCADVQYIENVVHLGPVLRAALTFSDISKGGNAARRADWESLLKLDLSMHNEASGALIAHLGVLNRFSEFRNSELLQTLTIELVKAHGYIGQFVRGETTLAVVEAFVTFVKNHAQDFCDLLNLDSVADAVHALVQTYFLMNVVDTAGVREGLMNDTLYLKFRDVAAQLEHMALGESTATNDANAKTREDREAELMTRLTALRASAIQAGETPDNLHAALKSLNDANLTWLFDMMAKCSLWYFEAATGCLSALSQLKMLVLGLHFVQSFGANRRDLFHLDFVKLANTQHQAGNQSKSRTAYRIRLLDAIMTKQDINALIDGTALIYQDQYILSMTGYRGGQRSVSLVLSESEEAEALITLLSLYECKSTVFFHSALKMLCDLYGLRKDDFDRLSNESQYLATMNAAKSDKARMLRWLKPGHIVEVGPGGGVVLDLLERYFPDSMITGLDASSQVVAALKQKKKSSDAKWQIIEGNAFAFDQYFKKDSLQGIVFCSILHEIYSYVEADDGTRFHLESVQKMLCSAFETLAPGGRILIRDGIMPPHKRQVLEFLQDDAKSFFEAFCREFKGRKINYTFISDNKIAIDSADAMEFMYTYTWGPESFPYEVREQYGIMTYEDYRSALLNWLGDKARLVDVPPEEASYLQSGYVTALQDKVRLTDESGNLEPFPPSNAIFVIEKASDQL